MAGHWLSYEMTLEDAATWAELDASYARYKAGEPALGGADARQFAEWAELDAEAAQAEREAAS